MSRIDVTDWNVAGDAVQSTERRGVALAGAEGVAGVQVGRQEISGGVLQPDGRDVRLDQIDKI